MRFPDDFGVAMVGVLLKGSQCNASSALEQFQEKWEPVFRPELRENKYLERITDFVKC